MDVINGNLEQVECEVINSQQANSVDKSESLIDRICSVCNLMGEWG